MFVCTQVNFVRCGTHNVMQLQCFFSVSPYRFDTDTSLTSRQIRKIFIDYFVENHKHVYIQSSSTIPHNDPTLYFVNAGMNQVSFINVVCLMTLYHIHEQAQLLSFIYRSIDVYAT